MYKRRSILGLLAGFAVFPKVSLSKPSVSQPLAEDIVRKALDELKLPWPAQLTLIRFKQVPASDGMTLTAAVEMEWTPGRRGYAFTAHERDLNAATAALLKEIESKFRAVGETTAMSA